MAKQPKVYLSIMIPNELKEAIMTTADERGESQAEVATRWLEAGRADEGVDRRLDPGRSAGVGVQVEGGE